MASIRKRGNRYYVDYRIDGKRVRRSAGTSHAEAQQLLHEITQQIQAREGSAPGSHIDFAGLCDRYFHAEGSTKSPNTQDRYRAILSNFAMFLSGQSQPISSLNQITPQIIQQYQSSRLKQQVQPRTVNSEILLLKKIFRMAQKSGWLINNPAEDVSRLDMDESLNTRYLTADEIERLLDAADAYQQRLLQTFLFTGLRKREFEQLTWDDIELSAGQLHVRGGQTHGAIHVRTLPLHPQVIQILSDIQHDTSDRSLVFADRKGRRLSKNYLRNEIIKVARMAGLDDVSHVHVLRNTFAAQLIRQGVDLVTVKQLMGGSDQHVETIAGQLNQLKGSDAIRQLNFGLRNESSEADQS